MRLFMIKGKNRKRLGSPRSSGRMQPTTPFVGVWRLEHAPKGEREVRQAQDDPATFRRPGRNGPNQNPVVINFVSTIKYAPITTNPFVRIAR